MTDHYQLMLMAWIDLCLTLSLYFGYKAHRLERDARRLNHKILRHLCARVIDLTDDDEERKMLLELFRNLTKELLNEKGG